MRRVIALCLALLATPLAAQDAQTLADIRQELAVVFTEVQKLRRELSTTGGAQGTIAAGSALERLDAIETQLRRLTARTEELENRIDRVVADGTLRVSDLEFRLCELEPGCDIGSLGDTPTLGGGDAPVVAAPAPAPQSNSSGPALASGEQADFDRAKGALSEGSFRSAADQFTAFAAAYPGGPLTAEALFLKGEALAELGETPGAARAYLNSFSSQPDGPMAAVSLTKLGRALADLGQTQEACVTLGEVEARFPGSEAAFDAAAARGALGCP